MFWAAHRSSSGALNCICSLWFICPYGDRPLPKLRGYCSESSTMHGSMNIKFKILSLLYWPCARYLYIVPGHGTFILSLGTVPLCCPWTRYLYIVPGHGTFFIVPGHGTFILSLGTVPLYCPWARYLYIVSGHGTFILSLGTVLLSHRSLAWIGKYRGSCRADGRNKRDTLSFVWVFIERLFGTRHTVVRRTGLQYDLAVKILEGLIYFVSD